MGQSLIDYSKLSDREVMILVAERQVESDKRLAESNKRLDTMSECLSGTNEILNGFRVTFAETKSKNESLEEKIKENKIEVDKRIDDLKSDWEKQTNIFNREFSGLRRMVLAWNIIVSLIGGAIAVMMGAKP